MEQDSLIAEQGDHVKNSAPDYYGEVRQKQRLRQEWIARRSTASSFWTLLMKIVWNVMMAPPGVPRKATSAHIQIHPRLPDPRETPRLAP